MILGWVTYNFFYPTLSVLLGRAVLRNHKKNLKELRWEIMKIQKFLGGMKIFPASLGLNVSKLILHISKIW